MFVANKPLHKMINIASVLLPSEEESSMLCPQRYLNQMHHANNTSKLPDQHTSAYEEKL